MKIHATHGVEDEECRQDTRIAGMERELGDLNKIVIRGNGKPSLVSQVAVLDTKLTLLCWLVGVTCAAVIGQIVSMVLKHG